MAGDLYITSWIISLSPLSLATDVTDTTLGAHGLWLETRTGVGGTATQAKSSMDSRCKQINSHDVEFVLVVVTEHIIVPFLNRESCYFISTLFLYDVKQTKFMM